MFCKYCGKQIKDGTKFCPSCGNAVGSPAPKMGAPVRREAAGKETAAPKPRPEERIKPEKKPKRIYKGEEPGKRYNIGHFGILAACAILIVALLIPNTQNSIWGEAQKIARNINLAEGALSIAEETIESAKRLAKIGERISWDIGNEEFREMMIKMGVPILLVAFIALGALGNFCSALSKRDGSSLSSAIFVMILIGIFIYWNGGWKDQRGYLLLVTGGIVNVISAAIAFMINNNLRDREQER